MSVWRPSASIANLKQRAEFTAQARAFFAAREVYEVQTPLLATAGNPDLHIDSVPVDLSAGGYGATQGYLNTSPEFCMKRLLAAGSGDIYQLCPAFRAGEAGRWHNPEFAILEWYRLGFSMQQLMDEVAALVTTLAAEALVVTSMTWAEAWQQAAVDANDWVALNAALQSAEIDVPANLSLAETQDLAFSLLIQPQLGSNGLCFVYHYPAEQASLAKLDARNPKVAERFELFWQGVELANGFVELVNAKEQRQRFEQNNADRALNQKAPVQVDEAFLAALEHGLPDCAGVAVGFDRLLALLLKQDRLSAAVSFNAALC